MFLFSKEGKGKKESMVFHYQSKYQRREKEKKWPPLNIINFYY